MDIGNIAPGVGSFHPECHVKLTRGGSDSYPDLNNYGHASQPGEPSELKIGLSSFRAENFPVRAQDELDIKMFRRKLKIRSLWIGFRSELNFDRSDTRSETRIELKTVPTLMKNKIEVFFLQKKSNSLHTNLYEFRSEFRGERHGRGRDKKRDRQSGRDQ